MEFEKLEQLEEYLKHLGSVAIAFSGGVDSTFLLYVARETLGKDNVLAITIDGTAMPKKDIYETKQFTRESDINHIIIEIDQLAIPGFKENREDRCYVCKKALFWKIKEVAKEHNFLYVADGSNYDDFFDYRPGMKVLRDLRIRTPLMWAHLTKKEIRELSGHYGLKTTYKPSSPCLATRIKHDEEITEEKLRMIEEAEEYLRGTGASQVRVRMIGKSASVEVRKDKVGKLYKNRESVIKKLKEIGFEDVAIDTKGYRSGNMNKKKMKEEIIEKTGPSLFAEILREGEGKQTLYLECSAGISGDMTVAALLDLGVDQDALMDCLNTIPIEGFKVEISRVEKAGLDCMDFNVILEEDNHDHDMEYLHGDKEVKEHNHEHRHLEDIMNIIDLTQMSDNANWIAARIFEIIAEAEAKAHGTAKDLVHFHEVGAVDSIVDIIAVAFCLDYLDIGDVIVKNVTEGTGTVRCAHGVLPVPVPAVTNIVERYDIKLKISDYEGEFVTPTGAAIVAAVSNRDELPQQFKIVKTGLGAGKREYELPSILRAMIIEDEEIAYLLEATVDDCPSEALAYCVERLMEAGAKDAHFYQMYMKKGRPGWMLRVVCEEDETEKLSKIIFRETTTIGIKTIRMDRRVLPREIIEVETEFGKARVKVCNLDGENVYYPEYEDVAKLARENDIPYLDMYNIVRNSVV
ncbi:MAG: nickel pincer cofactor biosynthesis protein LarC [Eubacterium sp.]|nr:nickel pincer cofactor biosynthesis protein LarC [Eubacterium sp.]